MRGLPVKRFLDDPARIIEPHEFGDFRKELVQVLQEVRQEMTNYDSTEEDEKPSKSLNLVIWKCSYTFFQSYSIHQLVPIRHSWNTSHSTRIIPSHSRRPIPIANYHLVLE